MVNKTKTFLSTRLRKDGTYVPTLYSVMEPCHSLSHKNGPEHQGGAVLGESHLRPAQLRLPRGWLEQKVRGWMAGGSPEGWAE